MQFATSDILTVLLIIAVLLLIVVLYNVLFIVVDMRKIARRMNAITEQVEGMIMKPLSLVEESMTWLTDFLLGMYSDQEEKKNAHKKHR